MVDYSKWDKLAALISSSEDEDDIDNNNGSNKYDGLLKDKFNVSIHSNKVITSSNKQTPQDIDDNYKSESEDDLNDMAAVEPDSDFLDAHYEQMAPIFHASNVLYNAYEEEYHDEIHAIAESSKKIAAPKPTRSQYEIDNHLNHWCHICMDSLNLIFEFAINPNDEVPHRNNETLYDAEKDPQRFTIILSRVCKHWRQCCLNNDDFWYPVMEFVLRGGKHRGISWKNLLCVPKKYLSQFCKVYNIDDMTDSEKEMYHQTLIEHGWEMDDDEIDFANGCQTNPFLLIQCLKHCPNTHSVYLSGILCDEMFYAMGKYCNDLRRLTMPYIRGGSCDWFRHLVKEDSKCMDTLFEVGLERSYWVSDEVLEYLGQLRNLQSIEMDRLYGISASGLRCLFEGDRGKEMRNIYLTRGIRDADDDGVEFMELMIKNGTKMIQFDFSECEGFHDDMLRLLEDKKALPNLRYINVRYTGCTAKQVKRLQAKRPNLEIDFEEREHDY
eukprot:297107_1